MKRGLVALALAGVVASACGARTPLLVDLTCRGPTLEPSSELPTLYYVLDHSGSMRINDKWGQVRAALATVMSKVDARARFATVIFPDTTSACAVGKEVMPPRRGNGVVTIQEFLTLTAAEPNGGTPTAATLQMLADKLDGAKNTVVVLATDGGPNCNDAIKCETSACILNIEELGGCSLNGPNCCQKSSQNCIDDARTVAAVTALAKMGVLTFVVGIPGSELYRPVLDAMAAAGGTARAGSPAYYRVDTSTELVRALDEISSRVVKGCALTLDRAPTHPEGARVSVRGAWRTPGVDFAIMGNTLTLLGQACADYDGDAAQLHVEDGCAVSVTP